MAWKTLSPLPSGWLATLEAYVGKVEGSVRTTKGVVGIYDVPSGWMNGAMIPPIYRHTVIQSDVTTVTEYRGLSKATAKSAAQDPSMNTISTDANGRITSQRTSEAHRQNEADGWSVVTTLVETTYTENVVKIVS